MTRQAKYMARRRQTWQAAGLCAYCGKDSDGQRRCPTCKDKHTRYMAGYMQRKRKS